jgi:hypothetical protein
VHINEISYSFRPEAIEVPIQQPDYEQLFLSMEHESHNGIQVAIGGDVMFNTAPYSQF